MGVPSGMAASEEPTTLKFLKLDPGQRHWFYEGAFRSVAHLVSMHDKKKGDCVAKWYLRDREAKQKLIEAQMARIPQHGETSIILGLLTQACGKLYAPG